LIVNNNPLHHNRNVHKLSLVEFLGSASLAPAIRLKMPTGALKVRSWKYEVRKKEMILNCLSFKKIFGGFCVKISIAAAFLQTGLL